MNMIKVRNVRWVGDATSTVKMRKAYKIIFEYSEEKKRFSRPSSRSEDDIKVDLTRWRGLISGGSV
jgi:hypothetical protein